MDGEKAAPQRPVGFLTTVESPSHGIFGGYLLVDGLGRPLEFHCTTPIRVSRAQQILYGPTLEWHLHGRQIGGTLLAGASLEPGVVLVDQPPLLHVQPLTRLPVALVTPVENDPIAREGLCLKYKDCLPPIDLEEPFERIRAAINEAQSYG